MTKPARKAQIAACRQQGRDDRDAGLSVSRYRLFYSMDEQHKKDGWEARDRELTEQQQSGRDWAVEHAISRVSDEATRAALRNLFEYVKEIAS